MTADKLRSVVCEYEQLLSGGGFLAREDWLAPACRMPGHCLWMLQQMNAWLMESEPTTEAGVEYIYTPGVEVVEKCLHWLGLVQGVLCTLGAFTLAEVQSHLDTGQVTLSRGNPFLPGTRIGVK